LPKNAREVWRRNTEIGDDGEIVGSERATEKEKEKENAKKHDAWFVVSFKYKIRERENIFLSLKNDDDVDEKWWDNK